GHPARRFRLDPAGGDLRGRVRPVRRRRGQRRRLDADAPRADPLRVRGRGLTHPGALVATVARAAAGGPGARVGGLMPTPLERIGYGSAAAASLTSGFWCALAIGRLLVAPVPFRA